MNPMNPNQIIITSAGNESHVSSGKSDAYLDLLLQETIRTNQLLAGLIELQRQIGQIQLGVLTSLTKGGKWSGILSEILSSHPEREEFIRRIRELRETLVRTVPLMLENMCETGEKIRDYLEAGADWTSLSSVFNLEISPLAHTLEAIQLLDNLVEIDRKKHEIEKLKQNTTQ